MTRAPPGSGSEPVSFFACAASGCHGRRTRRWRRFGDLPLSPRVERGKPVQPPCSHRLGSPPNTTTLKIVFTDKGMRPEMARLTLARKIATVALTILEEGRNVRSPTTAVTRITYGQATTRRVGNGLLQQSCSLHLLW